MSNTNTAKVITYPYGREEQERLIQEIIRQSDAKVWLPEAFVKAAVSELADQNDPEEIARLTATFKSANFISFDDTQKDPNNEGQLLQISIDLNTVPNIGNRMQNAESAMRLEFARMGYVETKAWRDTTSHDGKFSMTLPAYKAPKFDG